MASSKLMRRSGLVLSAALLSASSAGAAAAHAPQGLAAEVNPFIGTAGGGNVFPGAVVPFGMVQWSPETTRGDATRRPAAGGYAYDATRTRGFSLTHLSGTGCRGASGDVPMLPFVGAIASSPSADAKDETFVSRFSHANESASPGFYEVRLENGVHVELTATTRTGAGRFTFPAGAPAAVLLRVSDSEVGSSDATVEIDAAARTVSGSVTSGNFCGYIHEADRRSYYTLYFVAVFEEPFSASGTWVDKDLRPGTAAASGGTTYGTDGYPVAGKGSGAYVTFDTSRQPMVHVRVGISYVSLEKARANLEAENPAGTSLDAVAERAEALWNERLGGIRIEGGTTNERVVFYTALYHSLLHPNVSSDVDGEYRGFDGRAHRVAAPQRAQYANFSGWDVYRSELQLVTLLDPRIGSDIAQSLLNQATENGGVWDRWTHNSGATAVMTGDPSAIAIASIAAFGGTDFDVSGAFTSLARAARTPTALDLGDRGCPVECAGQRPALDLYLKLGYHPAVSNTWGGAAETLEEVSADFALAQLAERLGDAAARDEFLRRSGNWHNLFNPGTRYIQNRNADGSWPAFDPASDDGFAEGSSAQYTWMVPFDVHGLIVAMGGEAAAARRLDDFFHNADGSWALTVSGGLHSELDNEPSLGAPWVYLFTGHPQRAHATIREAVRRLWTDTPHGIPGNDDLGEMSSWYVFAALGVFPYYPGRAELLIGSPLFPSATVLRPGGKTLTIRAAGARAEAPYVAELRVNGERSTKTWLPASFLTAAGRLEFTLAPEAKGTWGTTPGDMPPSFPARP